MMLHRGIRKATVLALIVLVIGALATAAFADGGPDTQTKNHEWCGPC